MVHSSRRMDRLSAPVFSNTLHFLKCTLKFCSSQGHKYRSGPRLTSYYPRALKTDFWLHWSATVVKYILLLFFCTPPFIQCDPERFCLFVPKTFFYWTIRSWQRPTGSNYGSAVLWSSVWGCWEQFRLINQSVECQEGGKSTKDSILLHCLLDWFANGDAKVRTGDLKGFKMSVSWGFSGVDWWRRLLGRSFYSFFFFFFTEFKTTETRRSRKHWENQVGYENVKMLFCLTRWEPPSVAGTCATRRTKLTLVLCCSKNRAKSTWKIQWLHVFRETMSWLVWIIHRLRTEQLLC